MLALYLDVGPDRAKRYLRSERCACSKRRPSCSRSIGLAPAACRLLLEAVVSASIVVSYRGMAGLLKRPTAIVMAAFARNASSPPKIYKHCAARKICRAQRAHRDIKSLRRNTFAPWRSSSGAPKAINHAQPRRSASANRVARPLS